MKKTLFTISLLVLFLTLSCSINPVTRRPELSLVSEKGEIALGEKTDKEIRSFRVSHSVLTRGSKGHQNNSTVQNGVTQNGIAK